MKKAGVIFGGRSVEHEVSVITGMQIIENMDRSKYQPVPIYITKEGKWLTGESLLDFGNFKKENFQEAKEIFMTPVYNNYNLYANPEEVGLLGKKNIR